MSAPKWLRDLWAKAEAARSATWATAIDANAELAEAANPQTILWLLEMLQELRHLGRDSNQIAAKWKAYQAGPPIFEPSIIAEPRTDCYHGTDGAWKDPSICSACVREAEGPPEGHSCTAYCSIGPRGCWWDT